jgi:molybdopterin-containing oxidoreductase family iron-sulfur binding subunit
MDLDESLELRGPERSGGGEPVFFARRDFLKLAGLSATALAACERLPVRHAIPLLVPPEEVTPGVTVHYAGTCTACPAACGMVATVRDGRPVKLEGHQDHALSQGGLCAVGQADLRALYDGHRLRQPSLGGKDATWADVDGAVKATLEEVKASGKKVAVLSSALVSPTAREAVLSFLAPYQGTLVEHDPGPGSPSALREAYQILTGRALAPSLDVRQADLLVGLGADLLGTGPDPVAFTAAWAARRRAADRQGAMHQVQIEGSLSLTGANADERWLATSAQRRLIALSLLGQVAQKTGGGEAVATALQGLPPLGELAQRVQGLAGELLKHRGKGLIVSGANDLGEQLAVALVNRLLGNEGKTVDVARPSLLRRGLDRELAGLLESLKGGELGALFVLGLDPVEQLPDGDAVAAALGKLPLAVAITDRPTATAAACRVVAAAHHGLETWGDFEPRPGVLTLSQPMTRPLFDTRAAHQNFLHWSGAATTDYRLHLMERWRKEVFPKAKAVDFGAFWTAAVGAGKPSREVAEAAASPLPSGAAGSAAQALAAAAAKIAAPAAEALEVELIAEVALRDGQRAHLPWLRELPDPLTRACWVPCVRVAPKQAEKLGVKDGDLLTVEAGKASLTMGVRIMPGQHESVLAVPVGYGRSDDVKLSGVEAPPRAPTQNAYRLARMEDGRLLLAGLGASARVSGGREALPLMQVQSETAERPVIHQVAAYDEKVHGEHLPEGRDLFGPKPQPSPQWHLAIDLDACTGCSACVIACQAENNIATVGPEEMERHRDMHWLRIDRYFVGEAENPDVLFEPMLCQQCGHAPCETVCPVAATVHSTDGLNQQVYNRCVGTRYCANNCPYKTRRFNWFNNEKKMADPVERLVLNPDVVVRSRGVMEKCTFCVQRLQASRIAAQKQGRQEWAEVETACQQSCPARAISFGDQNDDTGPIAIQRKKPRAFQVLAELGVEPRVTYLARVRNRRGAAGHQGEEA